MEEAWRLGKGLGRAGFGDAYWSHGETRAAWVVGSGQSSGSFSSLSR
jgi:hypothetical protein